MKVIICNTPRGQYHIPLMLVAEHRAEYYSKVDGYEIGSEEWKSEVDFIYSSRYDAIDWLLNNSNWVDWEKSATKLNDIVKVTDDNFWSLSSDFGIQELSVQ